jgi:hypothetical protein
VKSAGKKRNRLGIEVYAIILASSFPVYAQQPAMPRIGYLTAASASATTARTEAFRHGLRELQYLEGKNIA